jgi:hypothetical protein
VVNDWYFTRSPSLFACSINKIHGAASVSAYTYLFHFVSAQTYLC